MAEESLVQRHERWWRELDTLQGWTDFVLARGTTWPDLLHRSGSIELPPELRPYVTKLGVQSPDLEWALGEFVKIDTLNPTKFDAFSLEEGPEAEKDVEKLRIWRAASWMRQNKDGQLDAAAYEAMNSLGVAVERTIWEMPKEPKPSERNEGEDDDAYNERSTKERGDYFKEIEGEGHPFRTISVNPINVRWDPLDDPTRVLQQSRVRVTDAYDLTDKTGRHVTLDELGKVAFLGPDEPLPEYVTTAEAGERD